MWISRDVPAFAAIVRKRVTGAPVATFSNEMLKDVFEATAVSRRLLSFHCCFLKSFSKPHGTDCKKTAEVYDKTFGLPTAKMQQKLSANLEKIQNISTWSEYFESICLSKINADKLTQLLVKCIDISFSKRYHTHDTDFSKIHSHGVSSILLRGKSFARVAFCIDCSGSMGTTFQDSNGQSISRMNYVKREIKSIFDTKISPQQQFTFIFFHSRPEVWNKGLQQATAANVDDAMSFVNGQNPRGGTEFTSALNAAFTIPDVQAVYFLSDGEVYDSIDDIVNLVGRLSKNGQIVCHTTSFFAETSGKFLLQRMAKITNGTYLDFETTRNNN
jgi:hypothetical protein